jgi:hypothetical protein
MSAAAISSIHATTTRGRRSRSRDADRSPSETSTSRAPTPRSLTWRPDSRDATSVASAIQARFLSLRGPLRGCSHRGRTTAAARVKSRSEALAIAFHATRARRRSSPTSPARSSFRARKRASPSSGVRRPPRTTGRRASRKSRHARFAQAMRALAVCRFRRVDLVRSERGPNDGEDARLSAVTSPAKLPAGSFGRLGAEPACRIVRVSRAPHNHTWQGERRPGAVAGPASNGPSRDGAAAGRRARRRWRRLSRSTARWSRRERTGGAARGSSRGGCGWSGRGWR